jgi:V8-like Glu-specific endopeptidase
MLKALVLSLILIGLMAHAATAQDYEVSDEMIEYIRTESEPMPFPDTTRGTITNEPFSFEFKYDLEDRPPLPEWVLYRDDEKPKGGSPDKEKAPTRITDTETYPYSAVVHIYMKFGDYYSGCSGAFAINNYTILIAGHCLFN